MTLALSRPRAAGTRVLKFRDILRRGEQPLRGDGDNTLAQRILFATGMDNVAAGKRELRHARHHTPSVFGRGN